MNNTNFAIIILHKSVKYVNCNWWSQKITINDIKNILNYNIGYILLHTFNIIHDHCYTNIYKKHHFIFLYIGLIPAIVQKYQQ